MQHQTCTPEEVLKPPVIKFFSTCLVLYNGRTEYASTISLHEKYII